MANHALARLEIALRDRKLDRTLTTTLPAWERGDDSALLPIDGAALDACLHGGLPRGQLSEIVGPSSSGRTTLVLQALAASTQRGEIAALVDTLDRLDVASASAAGIDLNRLLWIRGPSTSLGTNSSTSLGTGPRRWGPPSGGPDAAVNRALKALNLVLQAGGFACVVLDLADVPPPVLQGIPFTTWLRVQRIIEGSDTACVVVAPQALARSARGLTLSLTGRARWMGDADRNRHLTGADLTVRVVSPRRRVDAQVTIGAHSNDCCDYEPQRLKERFPSVSLCL